MDWLANITLPYIIAAVAVLFAARVVLGKYKSHTAKSAAEIVESALIAIVLVFLIIRPFIVQAFYIPSGSMRPTLLESDHILVNKFVYRFHEPHRGDIVVFRSPPWASSAQQIADSAEWNKVIGTIVAPEGAKGAVRVEIAPDYVPDLKKLHEIYLSGVPYGGVKGIESASQNGSVIKFVGVDDAKSAQDLSGAQLRVSEKDFIKRLIGLPGDVIEVKSFVGVFRNHHLLKEPYIAEVPQYDMKPVKIPQGELFVMGDNRNNSNDSHAWGVLDRNRLLGKAMFTFWPLDRLGITR